MRTSYIKIIFITSTSKNQLEIKSEVPQSSRMKKVHDQVDSVYVKTSYSASKKFSNFIHLFLRQALQI